MTSSKSARVWKRTWVGALIGAMFALVLWISSRFDTSLPIVIAAGLALAVCVYEIDRMGTLAGRRIGVVLALPSLLWIMFSKTADRMAYADAHERPSDVPWRELVLGVVVVSCTTTLMLALVRGTWSMRIGAIACVAAALAWIPDTPLLPAWVSLTLFFFVAVLLARSDSLRVDYAVAVLIAALLIVPLASLDAVWFRFDHLGLVALILLCKIGDTAAYYVGNAFGKHHPFKSISPGKTTEGCIASLCAGGACGALLVACGLLPHGHYGLLGGVAGAAVVNLAAQASDLLESWFKRRAGVKDSGTWFGPSGGMLDLVDSFFLATPVALLVWPLLFEFTER